VHALESLHSWSLSEADDMRSFMAAICVACEAAWVMHATWTSDITSSLVIIYTNIIDRLPLMAGFVLDTSSRLQALRPCSQLGSQACVVALEAARLPQAIELLDHAHGVIWSQALHQRDPQLADVPPELALELESLLRAIAMPAASEPAESHLTSQDVRHEQNSRIQTLFGKIRAMPGLERFMRGNTFDTIRQVARDHPVVVLVSVGDESYAVIISSSSQEEPDVMRLGVSSERLVQLRGNTHWAGKRMRASTEGGWRDAWNEPVDNSYAQTDSTRLMRPSGQIHSFTGMLGQLWVSIVKPVLDHVGIEVRRSMSSTLLFELIRISEVKGRRASTTSLVPYRSLRVLSSSRGWSICRFTARVLS
jgi:hypothetical protein